jgi:hypothetical protein
MKCNCQLNQRAPPFLRSRRVPVLEKNKEYDCNVAFVSDGHVQNHLAQKNLNICFRTGHAINPLEREHIAYRTDDIDAFKAHLEENGISFSDWVEKAVAGWKHIFFYDQMVTSSKSIRLQPDDL